jgi:hypothetical protein
MSDFADVQQFARAHGSCGGLTPNAMSRPGRGGYQLTITCACGATLDRWVTPEEASRPLPRPTPARVTTWPARPAAPAPPARVEVAAAPVHRASRGRAVWLILLVVVGLGAAGVYVTGTDTLTTLGTDALVTGTDALTSLGAPRAASPPPSPTTAVTPSPSVAPAPPRPPLVEIAHALRELQTASTPTASLNDYAARVAATRVDVERLLPAAPEPARTQVQDVLDMHRLAVAAWRARTVDDRDEWARLGRDPAVELCPSVKRAADAAVAPTPPARARARGAAVAASLAPLWECAAEKLAALAPRPTGG